MTTSRESIFRSAIRSFVVAFFGVVGVGFALLPVMAALGAAAGGSGDVERNMTAQVIPDGEGKREALGTKGPVVLSLKISGVIGTGEMTTDKVRSLLAESREGNLKGDRVKALLLHINTPGGGVIDSYGIYQVIKEYKERHQIPVVAYIDGLCASGGMFPAMLADRIVAHDLSLVGNVGVITPPLFNFVGTMEKVGVESVTVKAGKNKDLLNPFRKWEGDEAAPLQTILDHSYDAFVNMLAEHRPRLDPEKLRDEYGANIFPASVAMEYGFIDEAGYSMSQAIALAAKEANIEDYRVVQLQSKGWLSDVLLGESPRVQHDHHLMSESSALQHQLLSLYRP